MFTSTSYLQFGNEVQRHVFLAIHELNILNDFRNYTPILCGTIPIAIDVKDSDLDIIMEVHDFRRYEDEVAKSYGHLEGFCLSETSMNSIPSVIANFRYKDFDFELFAQPISVEKQHAYQHMIIEHHLLLTHPHLREKIIQLKEKGLKTEPAFAKVFNLKGNPYEALLIFGHKLGVI